MLLLLGCTADPTLTLGEVRAVKPVPTLAGAWDRDFGKDPEADLGPLAVLADEDGFAVLDQENLRLLRYDADGEPRGEVAIPSRTTLDAARAADGWALLAYTRETISWAGQRLGDDGDLAETATGLSNPTGIFVDGDDVLVEDAHGETVDLATGDRRWGRPTGDGRYVRATKDEDGVLLSWSDGKEVRVTPDRPVGNVVALDARDGLVMLTLFLFEEGPAPDYAMIAPELRTVVLDDRGRRHDEVSIPPGVSTTVSRELALGPDGALWRLKTAHDGAEIERWGLLP